MNIYDFEDYNQRGSLRVSGGMWFWLFYSLRHALVWLGLSISHTPDMIYDLTDETHWAYLLCGIPVAMLLADAGFRAPDAGELARWTWKNGRWLMASSILLHLVIAVGLDLMKPEWTVSIGKILFFALDALGLWFIFTSQRVKDVFADFPARIEKEEEKNAKPEPAKPAPAKEDQPAPSAPQENPMPSTPQEPLLVEASEAVQIGIDALQSGQLMRAEQVFAQVLANFPDNADALHLSGIINHQRGVRDKAEQLILRAIAVQPGTALFHSNLGRVYQEQRRMAEAIGQYETALRIDPDFPDAKTGLESLKGRSWLQARK
ncbi:MAG: DUF2919 family protein [Sulfuricellaceae bacterium]